MIENFGALKSLWLQAFNVQVNPIKLFFYNYIVYKGLDL